MATDIPLGLSKAFRWVPHKFCDIIGCNHNRITKPTKTQIRTHLQKVCVRIFQYGAKLATGPREANASACATHEPAPKGMVQPPFRPIRLWRDLCSKMVHCTVFARRYARRRGLTGCGARIGQRPLAGRRLCDCGPGSGSLFPPQAAAAFAAVQVPVCTNSTSRTIATKKQPYAFRKAAPRQALLTAASPGDSPAGCPTVHWTVGPGAAAPSPCSSPPSVQTKSKPPQRDTLWGLAFGAPSGTRTQDPLIKSQLLYQLS